jgi:D-arabinose 1-dehydrogenase-like Zn-dependent alcohol dehydrogenase
VHACGVCGTDREFVHGGFPNTTWPLTPGHEIAGAIAELGDGVEGFTVGERVASAGSGATAITARNAAMAISFTARTARCPAGTIRAATHNR